MIIATFARFTKLFEVCKKKFNILFKQYKCDKMANGIYGESRHKCKSYDSIDLWCHQAQVIMKYVSTFANEFFGQPTTPTTPKKNIDFLGNKSTLEPTLQRASKNGKKSFHKEAICMFSKMVENNNNIVRKFLNHFFIKNN